MKKTLSMPPSNVASSGWRSVSFIGPHLVAQVGTFPLDSFLRQLQTGATNRFQFKGIGCSLLHLGGNKFFDCLLGYQIKEYFNRGDLPESVTFGLGLGVSTALRYCTLFPFDTATKRLQVSSKNDAVIPMIRQMIENEGVGSLYKGIQFGLPRTLLLTSATYPVSSYLKEETKLPIYQQCAISTLGTGGLSWAVYPLDIRRTLAQTGRDYKRPSLPPSFSMNMMVSANKGAFFKTLLNYPLNYPLTPRHVAVVNSVAYSVLFNGAFHSIEYFKKYAQGTSNYY